MSPHIVILGSNGAIGSELQNVLSNKFKVICFSKSQLDITDYVKVETILTELKPKYIINSAAFTNVDLAEKEQAKANLINSDSVRNIAIIAKKISSTVIHFSSDYVYDGLKRIPYTENDKVNPVNYYGVTKSDGDKHLQSINCNFIIIRTSWIYGFNGKNFVKTILEKALSVRQISVVNDQYGIPTSTLFLAAMVENIIIQHDNNKDCVINKLYNVCPNGETTWFDFAVKIINLATSIDTKYVLDIKETSSDRYCADAKRPAYSVLSNKKLCHDYNVGILDWTYYLEIFLHKYLLRK